MDRRRIVDNICGVIIGGAVIVILVVIFAVRPSGDRIPEGATVHIMDVDGKVTSWDDAERWDNRRGRELVIMRRHGGNFVIPLSHVDTYQVQMPTAENDGGKDR